MDKLTILTSDPTSYATDKFAEILSEELSLPKDAVVKVLKAIAFLHRLDGRKTSPFATR